jgi:hypothetical protein
MDEGLWMDSKKVEVSSLIGLTLSLLAALAGVVLIVAGIWTGDSRWGWTGALFLIPALLGFCWAMIALDQMNR